MIDRETAPWVLDQLAGEQVCAPCHQPAEVLSAVARLLRAGRLDVQAARDAVEEALRLRQELVPPTPAHVRRALDLGERIRILDELYLALADERECAVVTTDRRLARAGVGDIRCPPRSEALDWAPGPAAG